MNPRERVLAALNRRPLDRLPVDLWHTPEIEQLLHGHFGTDNALDLYRKMKLDKIVWIAPIYDPPDIEGTCSSFHEHGTSRSMWGTPLTEIEAGSGATYREFGEPPLRGFDTPESLDDFPYWPDPDRFAYDAMLEAVAGASSDFVTMGPWVSLFEIYCQMRGLEGSYIDLATAPDLVNAALDRIEDRQTRMMKRFLDRAAKHLDLVLVSDDMGGQNGLLLSLKMWDSFFKERMHRWCDLIHGYGLKVFYHTDGGAEPLIPRLLDCGIDVLNPIQHVCAGMDRSELKRKYGERVVFHGGIENQRTLPTGTAEEVRDETRECMRTLGAGREGYIVCSCHNVQPGTPLENILALIETVHTEGAVI